MAMVAQINICAWYNDMQQKAMWDFQEPGQVSRPAETFL